MTSFRFVLVISVSCAAACGDPSGGGKAKEQPAADPGLERALSKDAPPTAAPERASSATDIPACQSLRYVACDCSDVPQRDEYCERANDAISRFDAELQEDPGAAGKVDRRCRRHLDKMKRNCP